MYIDPNAPIDKQTFDGFTVEFDAETLRGDIILDRDEMNTISMRQRDQLCEVFQALDRDERVRIIVCLLYTSPSPRDYAATRMPSSA